MAEKGRREDVDNNAGGGDGKVASLGLLSASAVLKAGDEGMLCVGGTHHHTHTPSHTHTIAHTHTITHLHTHKHTNTHTHKHTHKHTHTHTHTHTHVITQICRNGSRGS